MFDKANKTKRGGVKIKQIGQYCSILPPEFWHTEIRFPDGTCKKVNDTCPVRQCDQGAEYYLNAVPYGPGNSEVDKVVQNGDLLTYLGQPPASFDLNNNPASAILSLLKQRGYHSEAAYIAPSSGKAHQVALWGDSPSDRLFHAGKTGTNKINIYRLDLTSIGVTHEREARLKRELLRWKEVFNRHTFPHGASMNYDPVDFTTVGELADIARVLLRRQPGTLPPIPHVNCVQWTCQTVSLSLVFPLTRAVVKDLGVTEDFERDWLELLGGYADDSLEGIGCLPIQFYTPARLLQKAFDMYMPGVTLSAVLGKHQEGQRFAGTLNQYLRAQGISLDPAILEAYLKQVVYTGDLDVPLNVPGLKVPYQVVMPSTFILEEREYSSKPPSNHPLIRYVATVLPVGETRRI